MMTTTNHQCQSPWTLESYRLHAEAMRASDKELAVERDRRYAEVATERALAMKIKETADLAALQLARESQDAKDLKASELRDEVASGSGHYATRDDLAAAMSKIDDTIKPIADFVANQMGQQKGSNSTSTHISTNITILISVVALLIAAYIATH